MESQRGDVLPRIGNALVELGYSSREPSGFFDRSTEESVISLQASALIEADGAVGPQTLMVLYSLLERYTVPRLQVREGDG